jgi:hypothetical protein
VAQWNNGKKEEFRERKMFTIEEAQSRAAIVRDKVCTASVADPGSQVLTLHGSSSVVLESQPTS